MSKKAFAASNQSFASPNGHRAPQLDALMPDVGIVAMVPDVWGEKWQPRHQILSRLATYFPVAWVDPPQEWRESLRRRPVRSVIVPPLATAIPLPSSFQVYATHQWPPVVYRPAMLANVLFDQRVRRARALLARRGCTKFVLYLWRPEFERALISARFDLTCYHVDDEYTFSPTEQPIGAVEARVLRAVNQVFIHSPALLEKKGSANPHTVFVPNGVDYELLATPIPEPADLAPIPHPRIGYAGYVKEQLDWVTLRRLIRGNPQWSFVFAGARRPHPAIDSVIAELSVLPNAHFLGAKSTHELAAYPQHFDVCIMPYQLDDYTKYIYPLKTHEYLASGRPTAGTRIRSLEEFEDVVLLVRSPDEWEHAIATALRPEQDTPERRAARQAVARRHDWSALVSRIATIMAGRLGPAYAARVRAVTTDAAPSLSVPIATT